MINAAQQIAPHQPETHSFTQGAIRLLGALERLFWLLDQNRPVHFAVTALISGETSPRDWRKALDRLQERHPIMSVCIDGEPGSIPSFQDRTSLEFRAAYLDGDRRSGPSSNSNLGLQVPVSFGA